MRKDTYYFSHDTNARKDPKCSALIAEFGIEGYGLYWSLIEIMHEQKDGKLQKFPKLIDGLAFEIGIEKEALSKQIEALLHDFELLKEDENYIWSDRVLRNIETRKEKYNKKVEAGRAGGIKSGISRSKAKQEDGNRSKTKQNEALLEANEAKRTKGKERKGKEIKGNNIEDIYSFWNNLDLVKHRNLDKFRPSINSALKIYTEDEIKQAMKNYKDIINSKDHYWTSSHWTIEEFLTRKGGIDRFITDNKPFDTFKSKFRNNGKAEVAKPNMFTGLDDKDYSEGAF